VSVKCPKCQSDNPDTSSYCADCGTQLGPPKDIPAQTKTFETPFPQFAAGTSLANRYEIIRELGKGGMGEVYLAEDTNLKRQVAIKVLPQPFGLDKERLARFEREARLLASLNHPNIATIHGLEKSDEQQFLVMELVEGDTLADRIMRGSLPTDEVLEVCKQIAEGLEAAHEKGIIHRDLKPSNVKVTPEGKVKILDFGLAKAFHEEPTTPATDLSKSPTLTDRMTRPGVILGTAAYMSPEQARSHSVDKRTDIWAFGCVLYECLTGKPVLQGETVTDTLALILKGEPDWIKLPANTPSNIRILLRRCLQKDPRKRLRDIGDARIEMEEMDAALPIEETEKKRFPMSWIFIFVAAGILLGLLIGIIATRTGGSGLAPSPVASVIKVEPNHSLTGVRMEFEFNWPSRTAMAISKDGNFIIYCAINDQAGPETSSQLFMRRLDKLENIPIPGTEGGMSPFLSPDNRWIGFFATDKLKKVSVEGGVPQDLCEVRLPFGASWGDDDRIVFTSRGDTGLFSIPSHGGKPEILTEPDLEHGEYSHRLPSHLPNGKGVLFTITRSTHDIEPCIAILEGNNKRWRLLLEDASDARYIPTGHLVFLRRGALMAVAFDLEKLDHYGQPVPVIPGVMHGLNSGHSDYCTGAGQYSVSASGNLAYVPGGIIPDRKNSLIWVDHKGNETQISSHIKAYFSPRLSQDGQRIVYKTIGTEAYIWVYDISRDISSPVILKGHGFSPIWTPEGNEIVFGWQGSVPPRNIYMMSVDGRESMERLITSQEIKAASSYSPDGNLLAYVEGMDNRDILIYDFRDKSSTPFAATEHEETHPEFAPDGRWIAYCSDEEGQTEIYVRPCSGIGETIKVSREGGKEPVWARSGKQIFYRSLDWRQMWAVNVRTDPDFSPGKPRLLFEKRGLGIAIPVRGYDISLDDQFFLMVKLEEREPQPVTEMILIQNWFEELKQLVPTRK